MVKVECSYKEDCSDVKEKCTSCMNNKKRSYYRPEQTWYWYYNPYHDYTGDPPYYPLTTTCDDNGCSETTWSESIVIN